MPLNIKDASSSGVSALNRWALQQENKTQQHDKQILQLQQAIEQLVKSMRATGLSI